MTGSVVLIDQIVPEKHLNKKTSYKYIPHSSMSHEIIEDFKKNANISLTEDMSLEIDVKIIVREYEKKVEAKSYYYDNKTKDDTKNT